MFIDPNLTYPDLLVLKNLLRDVDAKLSKAEETAISGSSSPSRGSVRDSGYESQESSGTDDHVVTQRKGVPRAELAGEAFLVFLKPVLSGSL